MTGVDDELGPGVLAARVGVAGPNGETQSYRAAGQRAALAAALGAPIRVADSLMDRLALPVVGEDLVGPFERRVQARPDGAALWAAEPGLCGRPGRVDCRRQLTSRGHRVALGRLRGGRGNGVATLAAAVPEPYGDVFLGQDFLADDHRGAMVTLRAEVRAQDVTSAELSLYIVAADPAMPAGLRTNRAMRRHGETITGSADWTPYGDQRAGSRRRRAHRV